MENKNYKIEKVFKSRLGSDYLIITVNDITYKSPKELFEQYVINAEKEHWNKVESWVDTVLMPYMTRTTINYNRGSYGLKHDCEQEIGEYVHNEEIKYLLAIRGVKCQGEGKEDYYPINLWYPLSQRYFKNRPAEYHITQKRVI